MKDGYVIKNMSSGQPETGEIEIINNYTRRKLSEDEVYVFSVVLCDNDIDREYERFTDEALEKLSELYIGKTGITNHDTKSENQTARIFSCRVEEMEGKLNKLNNPYKRLVARAYMPRSQKNEAFIIDLDSGIKKEVSVGCAVDSITCSICGADMKATDCGHIKGREYKGNLCHAILDNPSDAYEWSFVAVPAQCQAGVIKALNKIQDGGDLKMDNIVEEIIKGNISYIGDGNMHELRKALKSLKEKATIGDAYFQELKRDVIRLSAMVQPELNSEIMKAVADKMSVEELKTFKESFRTKAAKIMPPSPQLNTVKGKTENKANAQFKI